MRYSFFVLLLLSQQAFAQSGRILKFTTYPHVGMFDITRDQSGNMYATGGFYNTADFGGQIVTSDDANSSSARLFVAKYDENGHLLWLHTEVGVADPAGTNNVIDQGSSIVLDKTGNVYALGAFQSTRFTLDGVTIDNADVSLNSTDIVLIKYTPDGNLIWIKHFGGVSDDQLVKLAMGPDGNLYAVGSSSSPSLTFSQITLNGTIDGFAAPLVASFDTSGRARWAKLFPAVNHAGIFPTTGGDDRFESLAIDSIGNIYVSGSLVSDTSQIGDSVMLADPNAKSRVVLVKFATADGHIGWIEHSLGDSELSTSSIIVDRNNDPVLCSTFSGANLTIGGLTVSNPDPRHQFPSVALLKLDPSGTALWAKSAGQTASSDTIGGMAAFLLGSSSTSELYVSGLALSKDPISYNGSPLPLSSKATNFFLMAVNPGGNLDWVFNETFNGEGIGIAIAFAPDNSLYYAGFYVSNGNGNSSTDTVLSSIDTLTSFIMHLSENPSLVRDQIPVPNPSFPFPNPASAYTTIVIPELQHSGPLTIFVYDALGREVERVDADHSSKIILPCKGLELGAYNYRIFIGEMAVANGSFVVD